MNNAPNTLLFSILFEHLASILKLIILKITDCFEDSRRLRISHLNFVIQIIIRQNNNETSIPFCKQVQTTSSIHPCNFHHNYKCIEYIKITITPITRTTRQQYFYTYPLFFIIVSQLRKRNFNLEKKF